MSDRELLEALSAFFQNREFILGDEKTIRDMVGRYQRPPLTLAYRVAMKLSVTEYKQLSALLEKVHAHLNPPKAPLAHLTPDEIYERDMRILMGKHDDE